MGVSKWSRYKMYLINWVVDHNGDEFEGMSPASYQEWLDNEGLEEDS